MRICIFVFFQICILKALTSPAESNLFELRLLQRFPAFQGINGAQNERLS